mgnify:CR=1 FL=1|jgi:hypothetical protein
MEIEHINFLEANIGNYETAKNGYIRDLEIDILKMYEHIYHIYIDKNFILSPWCGGCKFEMVMRLYTYYDNLPKNRN